MGQLRVLRYILKHPMNRGRALNAVGAYLSWQIGSRLVTGAVAVPFANKAVLMVRRGMHGATQNIYCGLNDFSDMGFLLHLLRPEDLFVDVGANVGSYTVLASAAIGARTVAFEPNPATFPQLMTNININGVADRVDARMSGVGSKAGSLKFEANGPMTRVTTEGSTSKQFFESAVVRLDDSLNVAPVLIKIDVEGFESDVLAGAAKTLARPELLALIVENNGDCVNFGFELDGAHRLLIGHGFKLAGYSPRIRQLQILSTPDPESMNCIYVRDVAKIEQRLRLAAPFVVQGQSI